MTGGNVQKSLGTVAVKPVDGRGEAPLALGVGVIFHPLVHIPTDIQDGWTPTRAYRRRYDMLLVYCSSTTCMIAQRTSFRRFDISDSESRGIRFSKGAGNRNSSTSKYYL